MKRFIIRDVKTKEIKTINYSTGRKKEDLITLDFSSTSAALEYLSSMGFGLGDYYEIYDTKEDIIIPAKRYKIKERRGYK